MSRLVAVVALARVHAVITGHPVWTLTREVSRFSTVVACAATATATAAAHPRLRAVTGHVSRLTTVVATTTTTTATTYTQLHLLVT